MQSGGQKEEEREKKNEVKKHGCDFLSLSSFQKFKTKIDSSRAGRKNPEESEDLASRKSCGATPREVCGTLAGRPCPILPAEKVAENGGQRRK